MSLLRSPPIPVGSSSYQTTQATVSSLPVKAMSGSTPERVGSMLSVGSPFSSDVGEVGSSRSRPTCCQQKPFSLFSPAGNVPTGQAAPAVACLRPFTTKICRSVVSLATPAFSSHATEDLLAVPARLLERRPRDLDLAGRERPAGHVGDASVLVRVDRIGDIVVHLRAVGRKRQEGRPCCRAGKQHAHGRKTGDRQPETARARGHFGRLRLHETFLLLGFVCGSARASMPPRFGPQELIVGNATSEPRGRMHVARGDTASTARSRSTPAARGARRRHDDERYAESQRNTASAFSRRYFSST